MTPKAFEVDSSVLLDVLTDSAAHADSSEHALRKAAGEDGLIICECVLEKIARHSQAPAMVLIAAVAMAHHVQQQIEPLAC